MVKTSYSILFASSSKSLVHPMLCRCCGLCSLRNRKINIVWGVGGGGENVSEMLKNQISVPSVSTLLSPNAGLRFEPGPQHWMRGEEGGGGGVILPLCALTAAPGVTD